MDMDDDDIYGDNDEYTPQEGTKMQDIDEGEEEGEEVEDDSDVRQLFRCSSTC